jgi:hypothetical protein
MNFKFAGPITVAVCSVVAASSADASTIIFSGHSQGTSAYTTFADGTFSVNGFFPFGVPTQALAGSQNDAKIFFTTPVELNSLTLSAVPDLTSKSPTTITVLTFDSSNHQLESEALSQFGILTFNEMGVSIVEFDAALDEVGSASSYLVSDVTYTLPAVPEPSTWAMLLLGFLSLGLHCLSKEAHQAIASQRL